MNQSCEHCEYEWISRIETPKACPRCKRRFDYPGERMMIVDDE
ncbi:MAG: hypothetical protein ABIB43_03850 [archaeon]